MFLINFFSLFQDYWNPRIAGELNGQQVKLVKFKGEFVWHKHDDTDDFFLVLKGKLVIELRDRNVELGPGELFTATDRYRNCL